MPTAVPPPARKALTAAGLIGPLLGLLLALAAAPALAAPGARVALVIGNSAYASVERLANPGNDARLVAQTLQAEGFSLVGGGAQLDLGKRRFDDAVQQFGRAAAGAEVALFYYSGHGMQVDGVNYLVPVDANPSRAQDLDFQMVSADLVLHQMAGSGTRLNIVILDACRNNPFGGRGLRAAGGGLAEMKAPDGTLISYATQPGAVARDGAGRDSPFTLALVEAMRQPGLDVFRMFNQVGLAVKRDTGGTQQPWLAASPIEGDFAFAEAGRPAVPAAPAPPPATEQTVALAPPLRQSTPAPAPAPATPIPGGLCPPKDLIVSGENEVFDWNGGRVAVRAPTATWAWRSLGSDPADPAVCLRAGGGGPRHRVAGWFNTDAFAFNQDPARSVAALLGEQADTLRARFTDRNPAGNGVLVVYTTDWRRRGHEAVAIGGQSYDTLVFDVNEASSRNSFLGSGRMWYAPALRLFVRRIWRRYDSDDVLGWSVTNIASAAPGGAPISASEPP